MEGDDFSRRPIKARKSAWASKVATILAKRRVSPNSISLASMFFSTVGAGGFCLAGTWLPWEAGMVIGVAGCQLRLVCNLLDGMVAIEGGRKEKGGDFLNEAPDRYSDIVLMVGAGVAAGAVWLGWMAACFSILTAYLRTFGAELTNTHDFCGPMAKPQRMFALTVGGAGAVFSPFMLELSLWVVALGAGLTSLRRAGRVWRALVEGGR